MSAFDALLDARRVARHPPSCVEEAGAGHVGVLAARPYVVECAFHVGEVEEDHRAVGLRKDVEEVRLSLLGVVHQPLLDVLCEDAAIVSESFALIGREVEGLGERGDVVVDSVEVLVHHRLHRRRVVRRRAPNICGRTAAFLALG